MKDADEKTETIRAIKYDRECDSDDHGSINNRNNDDNSFNKSNYMITPTTTTSTDATTSSTMYDYMRKDDGDQYY